MEISKPKIKRPKKTEHNEQTTLCQWLDLIAYKNKIRYFAVPNGVPLRSASGDVNWGYINKLKKEGVKKGVADLILLKEGSVLFLEMKRKSGGSRSEDQKEWAEWLNNNGFRSVFCNGFEDAKKVIEEWMK